MCIYIISRTARYIKVHIFWEGHQFLRNLHCRFVLCSNGQIYSWDFAKLCGLILVSLLTVLWGFPCSKKRKWYCTLEKFLAHCSVVCKVRVQKSKCNWLVSTTKGHHQQKTFQLFFLQFSIKYVIIVKKAIITFCPFFANAFWIRKTIGLLIFCWEKSLTYQIQVNFL